MALNTKIDLSISSDWKTITITDTTGSGITGYGSNQDPVGYREASGVGTDVFITQILLTSPSGTVYTFNLNSTQAYAAIISGYTITNTALGYAADEQIDEGIWKVSYTPYFYNAGGVTINVSAASTSVVYTGADTNFTNAVKLVLAASTVPVYFTVSGINPSTNVFTLSAVAGITSASYTDYVVGYETVEYIPIVKVIKDCLDAKVAALPESNCPCKDKQVNTLMNNYMLYDAMFINAANGNNVKADYIYDILSTYCADDNCNCNG